MINWLIFFINTTYLFTGVLELWLAPKIGPNPYFGFKVGYTFADREVWNRTNRLAGLIIIIHAIMLCPFIFTKFFVYYILFLVVPTVAFIPFELRYSAHLLELRGAKTSQSSEIPISPVVVSLAWPASSVLLFLLLLILELMTYSHFSSLVATHFDWNGTPNGWSTRSEFLLTFTSISSIFPLISFILIFVSRKYPIFVHPGKMRFPRDVMVKASILSMNAGLMIMLLTYISIYMYAITGTFPSNLVYFSFAFLLIPLAYLVAKWKKS